MFQTEHNLHILILNFIFSKEIILYYIFKRNNIILTAIIYRSDIIKVKNCLLFQEAIFSQFRS